MKQLESKGLVSRKSDTSDKRRNLVQLTALGKSTITRVQQAVREFDVRLAGAARSSEREQERLAQLLRKLLVSLEPTKSAAARAALVAATRLNS